MKKLIHTTNNAYDMTLLVSNHIVTGAWDHDADQYKKETTETIQDWDGNCPDFKTIESYGEIVETK